MQKIRDIIRSTIHIRSTDNSKSTGLLQFGHKTIPCILGSGAIRARKSEGDGATPSGSYKILYGFFRADRVRPPSSRINLVPLKPDYCWCDDPESRLYNRFISTPGRERHEKLWRDDNLYDICLVLDHNQYPRKRNAGSAIFFHIKHPLNKPTQGCVAICLSQMNKILAQCDAETTMIIHS